MGHHNRKHLHTDGILMGKLLAEHDRFLLSSQLIEFSSKIFFKSKISNGILFRGKGAAGDQPTPAG